MEAALQVAITSKPGLFYSNPWGLQHFSERSEHMTLVGYVTFEPAEDVVFLQDLNHVVEKIWQHAPSLHCPITRRAASSRHTAEWSPA